eukprot:2891575-Rhodomonas_salina.3
MEGVDGKYAQDTPLWTEDWRWAATGKHIDGQRGRARRFEPHVLAIPRQPDRIPLGTKSKWKKGPKLCSAYAQHATRAEAQLPMCISV